MTMSNPAGSFVWYELMSPDPDASARFYGPVVGWKIASRAEPGAAMDYRMIERADGANAGGVMRLTDEMLRGGARRITSYNVCYTKLLRARARRRGSRR